jgi:hypothetical protein
MEETAQPSARSTLPIILIAALAQGWGLYGLHHALDVHSWPATNSALLIALYAAVVVAPLTVELLVKHARNGVFWIILLVVTGLFFYFGCHQGATEVHLPRQRDLIGDNFQFAFVSMVLWLLILPFIQGRLDTGSWRVSYATLFAEAWRNKLVLAEAALFTGLFWLLLELWQALFHLLSIDFFRELFEEPVFVYPVTSITFGIALHLIGSIDRLTSVVLEQLLNVLKWLAVVAGTLLTLFTAALALKLPGLVFSGEHAIGATWLLWLVAVMVLLLNAAYRDGVSTRPYPRLVATALRLVIPLTVVVSLTAFYALIVRTQHYGITVERVWALMVASAALIYSVGYSFAAFYPDPWMGRIARVNVLVALALMLTIAAALTPVISPARLSANSQFERILKSQAVAPDPQKDWNSPFHYLRFDSGSYGLQKLRALASLQNHPDADRIRRIAAAAIAQQERWALIGATTPEELRDILAKLPIYPAGRTLDPKLVDALVAHFRAQGPALTAAQCSPDNAAGVFVDLNDDGVEEFVLLQLYSGAAFENQDGRWVRIGSVTGAYGRVAAIGWSGVRDKLARGDFSTVRPKWKELKLGGHSYRVDPSE